MKIPNHAKKVFEGVIYDVYHWDQEMFDGSIETFEKLKRRDTVEILPIENGKILIAEQEQPTKPLFYSPFGGRQEEGEDSLEAAKRELLEESGRVSEDWELYCTFEDRNVEWNHYVYVARNCRKVADQELDAGEKIKILSFDFEEFLEILEDRKWRGLKLSNKIYRLKQNKNKLEEFRKLLFK